MADLLADDVKELLEKKMGDERILKQILRACEHDEVISNYERNYVKRLVEKHLLRVQQVKVPKTPTSSPPDVEIPPSPQSTGTVVVKPTPASESAGKNKKVMIIFLVVAFAIVVSAALSMSSQPDDTVLPVDTPITEPDVLSIRADLESYQKGDLISISGISPTLDNVNISITDPNNQVSWTETIPVRDDGRYSTLTIAGGAGWEESGTFTITAESGSESASFTFSFTG